ncbi:serine hydrolase [Williamsia sterculiae]|uniref:Beta-lactamase class A n=1 Tax=Williamsia sterculiae TaxID=1344003 RepID=A0A1N7GYL2_9NOCA|nr:hypothetical protein [Williamsia sterculiae]SIS17538.1 hypothetical protein SAMN05445060_3280 [Williamsia sterculiae]
MKFRTRAVAALAAGAAVATVTGAVAAPADAARSGLAGRVDRATAQATARGAHVQIAFLDRVTRQYVDNGAVAHTGAETASVVKVFIADDLLYRQSRKQLTLSRDENARLGLMLRSSDDAAATYFWDRYGRSSLVDHVVARYRLADTRPPSDGEWWDTRTSAADLVGYYDKLMGGQGGVFGSARQTILTNLRASTSTGTDGYNQRFGVPHALPRVPVKGVKQGWMIAHSGDWVHNSTAIVDPDGRYAIAVLTTESASAGDEHTRQTIDDVVHTLFPRGYVQDDTPFAIPAIPGLPTVQGLINAGTNVVAHGAPN